MNILIAHAGHGIIEANMFLIGLAVGAVVALVHLGLKRIIK
jgi:hypothetical protein